METVAALDTAGAVDQGLGFLAGHLRDGLAAHGYSMSRAAFVDSREVVFRGHGMLLSLWLTADPDQDILIAAESPAEVDDEHEADQLRLLLCMVAVRVLCEAMAVCSITWQHRGKLRVTAPERDFAPPDTAGGRRPGLRPVLSRLADRLWQSDCWLGRQLRHRLPREDIAVRTR